MMTKKGNVNGNAVVNGRRIDFLGYCFTHENIRLRKSIKQTFARKHKNLKNEKRRREVMASYWGWFKWARCKNLWNKITNYDMSFADKGINGITSTKDGQPFFDVKQIRIDSILNLPIVVVKFAKNIKTKHGPGRYVIEIKIGEDVVKIITNSFTLKSMLDQADEMGVLPIETVIKKKDIGNGRNDYYFE